MWKRGLCLALFAVCLLGWSDRPQAGSLPIPGVGGYYRVKVESLKEQRWHTVVRQQYDFSCGSAAVATLLTFHYNQPTNEATVFEEMYLRGDRQKIQTHGFSLLDMKVYLDRRGFQADGFRMTLDKFVEIGVPGIVLINTAGYRHFVVVKGISGDRVLVGDPALGTIIIPRRIFEAIWSGAVLLARQKVQVAKANFNNPRDWKIRPRAPIGQGVDRAGLGTFTLTLPGRNELGQ